MAPSIASSSATAPASRKISARSSTRPSLASTGSAPTASTSSGIATPDNGSASIAASISSKRSKRSDPTVSSTPCRPNTGTFSRQGALRPTPDGYRAAGVPDTIWNMDARVGAVTDAYDKGAREVDPMDLGTHTQLATNSCYSRNRLAATSRVAVLRFGGKNEPGKGGA